ncbi:Zip-domain-containing protein [Sordaria brevicollis]|uniref:Zip-domain-containing protein n=1 Tax=Sordaria brevicollis TaxID=83679 RepID=A0AAE0UCZ7_SORBR|nr:Zip-domain-containing protein [Sordaria brevicollis]
MNCPSRTDDAELEHPFWNQQPHYLAADLTTRQDLNGIANSRTHRHGSQGCEVGVCALNHHPGAGIAQHDSDRRPQVPPEKNNTSAGRWSIDPAPQKLAAAGGDDRACRTRPELAPLLRSAAAAVPAWVTWVLSVVVTSLVMTTLMNHGNDRHVQVDATPVVIARAEPPVTEPRVFKRASTCPKGGVADESLYNTPLHGAALAIIFGVSFLACALPVLMTRFPMIRLPPVFFFAVRHFGTGVLIATAFVHLLPTAFISLSNQCLDSFWTEQYPAMPGAIALAAIFMVTIVEMVFHPGRHVHHGPHESEQASGAAQSNNNADNNEEAIDPLSRLPSATLSPNDRDTTTFMSINSPNLLPSRPKGALRGRAHSIGRRLSHVSRQGQDSPAILPALPSEDNLPPQVEFNKEIFQSDLTLSSPTTQQLESQLPSTYLVLTPEQKHRKETLQCVLLECGILFHSVFIGMALSVSVGTDFVVLLIAIAFHQTFEGLALGSRIASINWPAKQAKQPWFMALAYGCTTPIGQAIGLATHRLYSPESEVGLVLVGTMNAISSGLLVFASLVELLSEDFLSDESWRTLRGRKRVAACGLVFAGAVGMSLVGAWA